MRSAVMLSALLLAGAVPFAVPAEPVRAQPHLSTEPLVVRTADRAIRLQVEVARTPDQQEAGLMFRRSVPAHGGMIFPMVPVREATFWMKNTIIPLDMVFIRADGTIARITMAKALDQSIDDSGEPVAAVLELGAGRAAALGIREGDRVEWRGLPAAS